METHVGIFPMEGRIVVYCKNSNKHGKIFEISKVPYFNEDTIKQMYTDTTRHLSDGYILGNACVYMTEVFDEAETHLKRWVVDLLTLTCVDAITQQNSISKDCGVIRIYTSLFTIVWEDDSVQAKFDDLYCKWNIRVQSGYPFKFEYLESYEQALPKYFPSVIIFENSYEVKVKAKVKNYFRDCLFFEFQPQLNIKNMVLKYLKIMAGEMALYCDEAISVETFAIADDVLTLNENVQNAPTPTLPTFDNQNNYSIPTTTVTDNPNITAVGIDLGTSRCCVAVNRKSGITTVPLDNTGERLLPSFVAFDEEHVKCGQVVVERLRHQSKSTVFDSKRIIGRSINDIEIDSIWPFKLIPNNNKISLEINDSKGVTSVNAEQVSAELLKHIKEKTEAFQGKSLSSAVITVPAAFTEAQKLATKEAAKIAGWTQIKLLPEPIAAALAYFIDRPIPNNSTVLLFDLGGGTLDVCIFKILDNQIHIISNTGDTKLGGRDFDTVLINHFNNILGTKHAVTMNRDKKYKLMVKCQKLKEHLSLMATGSLDIDEFDPNQDGIISISREEFQNITKPLLNKIRNTLNAALFDARCTANQINKVLHVGGGSRMPMIKQLLKDTFPQAEHCSEEHPDEVVAIGAAYYAFCNTISI